jgi:hypothetical protein
MDAICKKHLGASSETILLPNALACSYTVVLQTLEANQQMKRCLGSIAEQEGNFSNLCSSGSKCNGQCFFDLIYCSSLASIQAAKHCSAASCKATGLQTTHARKALQILGRTMIHLESGKFSLDGQALVATLRLHLLGIGMFCFADILCMLATEEHMKAFWQMIGPLPQ